MEVLVIAGNGGSNLVFESLIRVLQTSTTPIEILASLPDPTEELQDHQLLVTRKRIDRDCLSTILNSEASGTENNSKADASPTKTVDTSHLLRKLGRKSKKIKLLSEQVGSFKTKAEDAMQKAQHLEIEQEQFFDDVREMKTQFDKLAENHRKLMWEYLPARDPSLRSIPRLSAQLPETPTAVGKYPLEQVIGYGQYALVYSSSTPERSNLAIKAIDKQKLMDLVSLHRISSEIASLSDPGIRHPGILELVEVIHTHKHIYLVTECGGKDLFEFFGACEALEEDTIRPLLFHLAQAVEVLHRHNYCHRDLKPENVLYSPGDAHLVKLIDFGLCTKATAEKDGALHDFCGSPGFFAPELLLRDSYDGFKADIWSIGCILLELVLGNSLFSSLWMSTYELSVLKEPTQFAECVKTALARTREFCHGPDWKYSVKLRSALLGMLCENPSDRLTIIQVLDHPWLATSSASPVKRKPTPSAQLLGASHSECPVKRKSSARILSEVPIHPTSAPGTPRSHRPGSKLSLPSLSPEKPVSRCSPDKLFRV